MKILTCDVCKKAIDSPVIDRNYFNYGIRDICESCHDELELQVKQEVRKKSPFDYEWYNRLLQESIEKAMAKGTFEV